MALAAEVWAAAVVACDAGLRDRAACDDPALASRPEAARVSGFSRASHQLEELAAMAREGKAAQDEARAAALRRCGEARAAALRHPRTSFTTHACPRSQESKVPSPNQYYLCKTTT